MTFEKVAPGPGDASQYHRLAASEHKLWCFGLKGVNQPTYSFYHDTMLHGGEVYAVDPKNGVHERSTFKEIDNDENREDLLFSVRGKIYMLVYSHYDGLHFRDLLLFHPGKGFEKQHKLTVDAGIEVTGGYRFNVVSCVSDEEDAVYLAYLSDSAITLFKLQPANHAVHLVASLNVDGLHSGPGARLVSLAVHGQKAWAFYGETGCGFRWHSGKPIVIDLDKKIATVHKIHEEFLSDVPDAPRGPPFSFGGSRNNFLVHGSKGLRWLHVGGSRQIGLSKSEFVREIWYLDLADEGSLRWHKAKVDLPTELHNNNFFAGVSDDEKILYVADQQQIYGVPVTNL